MSSATLYGKLQSEKQAEENLVCRQMVKEINNFGVSQRQTLMLMYLLASELENVDQMKSLTKAIREVAGDQLFLIGSPETDNEIGGG